MELYKLIIPFLIISIVFVSGCIGQSPVNKVDEVTATTTTKETTTTVPIIKTYGIGDTLNNGQIELTVHSIRKSYTISSSAPKNGSVFLIIDFSIKNIAITDGYYFNPNYIEIEDEFQHTFDYSWSSSYLSSYFTSTTVDLGKSKRGEIAFEVSENSNNLTLVLKEDMWGVGIARIYLGNIENPKNMVAEITINKISYNWYDFSGTGNIYSVEFSVKNTGDVPIKPKYQIDVTNYNNNRLIDTKEETSYWKILPGETKNEFVSLYTEVKTKTQYTIRINLYDENTNKLVTFMDRNVDMTR